MPRHILIFSLSVYCGLLSDGQKMPLSVPGREPVFDPVGPGQVGAGHAERPEDALGEVAAQRLAGNVLDDLAERGEPVVAVGVPGARLRDQGKRAPVELGQRRHPLPVGHGPAQDRLERADGVDELGEGLRCA